MLRAQELELPGSDSTQWLWTQFEVAVSGAGFESWCDSYYNSNRDAIEDDTFPIARLIKDFREKAQKDKPTRKIIKGAFPTFGEHPAEEKDSGSEVEGQSTRKRPRISKNVRFRSPSPPSKTKKQRTDGDKARRCPACRLGFHILLKCFYVFPEEAPPNFNFREEIQKLVEKRLRENKELRDEVARKKARND